MKISIVIPTYNRKENLKKLFKSLSNQSFKGFEVILVDAGSDDGTADLVKEFGQFFSMKYILKSKAGFVEAVNAGLEVCEGEIFLRTDDDVVASVHWLKTIEESFKKGENIGGVTGPVITPDEYLENRDLFFFQDKFRKGNIFWRTIGRFYFDYLMEGRAFDVCKDLRSGAFTYGANFPEALKIKGIIEVDHHESCNMAVRCDLLKKINGFDPSFVGTAEYCDSDIAYKLRKLGFRTVFNPQAVIYHYPSKQGFFSKRFNSYHRIENFIRFYFRHIKPNTLQKLLRFLAYLSFLNAYFIYLFFQTGKIGTLGSLPSTVVNLLKYSIKKEKSWR
jgi:GT2 family glycosyltransferase